MLLYETVKSCGPVGFESVQTPCPWHIVVNLHGNVAMDQECLQQLEELWKRNLPSWRQLVLDREVSPAIWDSGWWTAWIGFWVWNEFSGGQTCVELDRCDPERSSPMVWRPRRLGFLRSALFALLSPAILPVTRWRQSCIREALRCCDTRPPRIHNGKRGGTQIRCATVQFFVSASFEDGPSSLGIPYSLHGIASKCSLAKMLTSPLYYLFPVGLEELYRVEAESLTGIISDLVRRAGSNHQISDFHVLCTSKMCTRPIQVFSKALLDSPGLQLSEEEQRIISQLRLANVKKFCRYGTQCRGGLRLLFRTTWTARYFQLQKAQLVAIW